MYRKEYANFYGFLGIGQFGNNATRKFEEAGYPCVIANSSVEDLSTIKNAKNKLHFKNGSGCHKNRKKSKALLKENLEVLIDEVRSKMPAITTLFIFASSAGGTGSGMLAAVAKILSKTLEINICIVTVLPSKSENFQSYANTIELFQEIEKLDCIGATFILDNSKHRDKLKINDIFFTHLDALLANENGSDYGCLDRSEIDQLLRTSGMALISKLGKDNSDKIISSLTDGNIYAPIEQNKVVKYIGLMSCNVQVEMDEIYSQFGMPIDSYIGTQSPANVCAIMGLTLPRTRLNEIKMMAQTNVEIIKKNMESANESLFEDSVDFIGAFDSVPQKKVETKVSSLDILGEFL
ncbi:MAG: hypothetical protein PHW34_14055 [Hespellia sp.]|nr:hypothetical protein [Hespellia sp.]